MTQKSLLYFTADWCGPCQQIKPAVKKLEAQYTKINFSYINVDLNTHLTDKFGISAMPTFVLLVNDKEIDRITGADQNKLKAAVERLNNH
jgi:thioredoxin 1